MIEPEAAPIGFDSFLAEVSEALEECGGRLLHRGSPGERSSAWWFSFRRAGCIYRIRFDPAQNTLLLDKGQGSFQVTAQPGWRSLESRELPGTSFPEALGAVRSFLARFR
jgi:hypothetical protein